MKDPKKRITIDLPADMYEAIRRQATAELRTITSMIRVMLSRVIKKSS